MQQFKYLRRRRAAEIGYASDVSVWSIQADDTSKFNRVGSSLEYSRDRGGRRLGCHCGGHAGRSNDSHLTVHKTGCQGRQSIVPALRPAKFNRDVLALGIAGFVKALTE